MAPGWRRCFLMGGRRMGGSRKTIRSYIECRGRRKGAIATGRCYGPDDYHFGPIGPTSMYGAVREKEG